MIDTATSYDLVREYTDSAKAIAWDTCHKIYILMDDEQVELMRSYGYGDSNDPDSLLTSEQLSPTKMAEKLVSWYENSCGLKFITAVYSDDRGFVGIIDQFENNDGDDD
jgi:hypothetical protein